MMRGGKEEEKDVKISATEAPMFPRLHVNDTEKGGPRAPPRNKMALYEQLSIPSQRFNSNSLPPPPQSTSSQNVRTQVNLHDRSVLAPFPTAASTSACSPEKVYSRSSDGENMKTMKMEHEKRSIEHVDFRSAETSKAVAECSRYPRDSSNTKRSRQNEVDDDDDFRVPTFVNSDSFSYLNKEATGTDKKRLAQSHGKRPHNGLCGTFNSSVQFPNLYDKSSEQGNTSDMKSVSCERNHEEQKSNDAAETNKHREKSLSHSEAATNLALPSKFSMSPSGKEHNNTINGTTQTHLGSSGRCQESWGNGTLDGHGSLIGRDIQNESAWRVRRELHLDASHGNIHSNPNLTNNCNNRDTNVMEGGPPKLRDKDRIADLSDTSMVDPISGLEISPDDVVGVIGPKQFWKARRAIVNQQRVFAVQVFELHRLIKVQKLIAGSPHLLLEENPCTIPQKVPIKNLAIESDAKSLSPTVKQKVDSQKPDQNTESRKENSGVALLQAPPLPAHDNGLSEGVGQPPRYAGPYSGNAPPVPSAPDNRSSRWCFQPPSNQWLVPVMSPSEGLIYKPYAGPCPPAAGLMAPVFGNYNPMSLPPGYSVPPCHQQQNLGVLSGAPPFALNYFPTPYGIPAMNSVISNSAVEQVTPMTGPKPNGQTEQNSRSSCNMSFPKSDAFTGHPLKIRASKDSELQGSSASSPCDRAQGGRDALPLFPMAPTVEDSVQPTESNCEEHHTRVIKVVPHNARSATESAARIFRSIQQERQQVD